MSKMSTLSFKESGRVRGSRGFRSQREGCRGAQHVSLRLVCFTLVAKNNAKWYHRWDLSPMLLEYRVDGVRSGLSITSATQR